MPAENSSVQSHGATVMSEHNNGVYATLFNKINLSPVTELGGIEVFQNSEALSEVSADERVTAAVNVFLKLIKQSTQKVERLDKILLDEHIALLDMQISRQLDEVMHHPDFQRVESTWRGVKSLIDQTDFRQNVRIELLDISKDHLVQDFEDAPEIAQYVRWPGQTERQPLTAHFAPKGFADEDRLWPKGDSAFSGYQLLLEYFSFREKFMFVTLCGLEQLKIAPGTTWFELEVVLREPWPANFDLSSEHIRLHAVPVINLFALEADPLTLAPLQTDYLLRPMRLQDGHTEIYSVDRVTASRNAERQDYVPFTSFRHKGGMLRFDAPERYFHTRLKRAANGLHDTWLILGGEGFDKDRLRERESLSLRLTGTHGQLPRKALQSTLLDTVVQSTQAGLRVRNLCAPTLPCYPPNRDRFHWRVLSHLGSNFLPMLDNAEVLRGTLALYDWTGSELNRRRLAAIVEVKHHLVQRFEKGFLLRGVDIEITLDANGFSGEGDISLFGEMLNRFFSLYADIHLYTQLTLILQPTGKCLRWNENHSQRIPG